jgi:hypothetical protein
MRLWRPLAVVGVLLSALVSAETCAAALGDNLVKLAPSAFKLPQNIGPLRYVNESRFRDRRMGRSVLYSASGLSLSIYVYDYGVTDLPDGPDSVAACRQFEGAKHEIEEGGNYQNVMLRSEGSRLLQGQNAPRAREAVYEFDRNGIHAVSVLWLIAADGYFLKVRLSLRAEVADELDEAREQILDALATSLAARPSKVPRASAGSSPEATVDIDANLNPAEASPWLDYAAELTRYSREHPQIRPPCGGNLQPGFAAELAARRVALREYLAQAPTARTSSYFDVLARVDAAGFLDEYVWYYLRDAHRDVLPPTELAMGAFETYRARELPTHVVQSGAHVRINTVRVLPLLPAP